jgi:exosortase A-associated hydrolase 1
MTYEERAFAFDCDGERLVGVLALPADPAEVGVVVVPGAPQYRVGAHRQFVALARRLAAAGIAVLRFDYRGSGDATGTPRSFETIDADIAAAVDALTAQSAARRVVLLGLCDGASAILLYWRARRDARIAAMVLFNPWVRTDASLAAARVRGYYGQRMLAADFWRKLLRGRVEFASAAASFLAALRAAVATRASQASPAFRTAMADGLAEFGGPVLFVLGGSDLTAREFALIARYRPWRELLRRDGVEVLEVAGADHTFTLPAWRREAEARTLAWLAARVGIGSR